MSHLSVSFTDIWQYEAVLDHNIDILHCSNKITFKNYVSQLILRPHVMPI